MNIALHFMTCIMLVCGVLIWLRRKGNRRQRTYLAITLLVGGAMMMLRVLLTYDEGIPARYPVLPLRNLYGGCLFLLCLFPYPIEVVNSGWLRWRNILLLVSPVIIITLVIVLLQIKFRELYSFRDVLTYIGEPNVLFRIVVLFVFMVPYTLLILYIPYNWRRSCVDVKWIRIYAILEQGIGVLFILFMLTGSLILSTLHMIYCTFFFLYITYQELYLRLFPGEIQTISDVVPSLKFPESNLEKTVTAEGRLWEQLEGYMREEKPWRSPDITVGDVAKAIGVSRSRLSAEISARGDESFHTLIARYRIEEFCKMARNGAIENVNEALFAIGFRSRSTAYDRFKEQTGITPAEYVKTIKTHD